jgi:hypothetical protein
MRTVSKAQIRFFDFDEKMKKLSFTQEKLELRCAPSPLSVCMRPFARSPFALGNTSQTTSIPRQDGGGQEA